MIDQRAVTDIIRDWFARRVIAVYIADARVWRSRRSVRVSGSALRASPLRRTRSRREMFSQG